jgi:hypothetical protein
VTYAWETVYPHDEFDRDRSLWKLAEIAKLALRHGAVASAARARGNAYFDANAAGGGVAVNDAGRVTVRRRTDLGLVADAPGVMTTTDAARARDELSRARGEELELLAVGVAG